MPVPEPLFTTEFTRTKLCKHGVFTYWAADSWIGRSLDRYGEWGEFELRVLSQLVKPGDTVLDVGANIGTHSVFFSKQVGPRGRVFAFEPQRLVHHLLCTNLALNDILNVRALQVGVGEAAGVVRLPTFHPGSPRNFGAVHLQGHEDGARVDVLRLDDLPLDRCNLIKIDVEGMESAVLRGATQTLQRHRPWLFVENNRKSTTREVLQALADLDYVAYWHIAPYFNADNHFSNPDNVFAENAMEANVICHPVGADVDLRGFEPVRDLDDTWVQALQRRFQTRQG